MTDLPRFVWKLIRNANWGDGGDGGGEGSEGSDSGAAGGFGAGASDMSSSAGGVTGAAATGDAGQSGSGFGGSGGFGGAEGVGGAPGGGFGAGAADMSSSAGGVTGGAATGGAGGFGATGEEGGVGGFGGFGSGGIGGAGGFGADPSEAPSGFGFTGPSSGLNPAAFGQPDFDAEFNAFGPPPAAAPSWAGPLGIVDPASGVFVSAANPASPTQAAGWMGESILAGGAPSAVPSGIDFGVGPGEPIAEPTTPTSEPTTPTTTDDGIGPLADTTGSIFSGSVDALSRGILGNAGGALGLPGLTGGITQDTGQGLPGGGGILPDDGGEPIQGESRIAPLIASMLNRMTEGGQLTPEQGQLMFPLLNEWAQIIPPDDPRWPQVLQLVQQQMSARAA